MKKFLMTASLIMMATLAQAATVAIVNGDKVDGAEVDSYLKLMKSVPDFGTVPEDELNKMAFAKLIEDKILIKEANTRGLNKAQAYTEAIKQVEDEIKKKGGNKEPNYDLRWDMTKKEILKQFLVEDIFKTTKPDAKIVKQMMDAYNKEHKGSKNYHFERIGVQKAEDVKKAYDELKKKTEFSAVKEKYDVLRDGKDEVYVLNSKDLEMDPAGGKMASELSKLKPGAYNQTAVKIDNFQFIFKMKEISDFKPVGDNEKPAFEEQSQIMQAQMKAAELVRDAKVEIKDSKYEFYTEALKKLKEESAK